ncbi:MULTISPECIES: YbaB/EbfC family nucleoid-associated protein [unclassified Pseudodesulfovibrio]|uniref:YbaB/EbfC family nucleoid-associated protein n=1 Tax=unclassified Pseudodesulfovibrio TaxID=2661612 RepID=UPI000FEB5FD6|nr:MULTISPECIES: YbaB/EbfC family nucleoid-associated protein [unclassified Pseudodesulfovibrio]MCJ2163944.1 YbaB/EbfC family nucleoid-associated protein [Pseudodesulfovibrio sp. S3-i]RWU05811.1 YbaB/EbfC family nucleoid-associated protein [Pseudodesulfovibrio sp. S3]
MKGMNEMMRQAQIMQRKMTEAQDALKTQVVEASSGGGMVTIKITGGQEVTEVVIEPSVMEAGDVEMLQDLVMTAANEAIKKSKEMMEDAMKGVTGGMSIPGMF